MSKMLEYLRRITSKSNLVSVFLVPSSSLPIIIIALGFDIRICISVGSSDARSLVISRSPAILHWTNEISTFLHALLRHLIRVKERSYRDILPSEEVGCLLVS